MTEEQLDLFSRRSLPIASPSGTAPPKPRRPAPATLDDQGLIEGLLDSGVADTPGIAAEIGRRRLAGAVPALATLCRRFAGCGIERAIPEQEAALQALEAIGGNDAARATGRMIEQGVVQGPTLETATAMAGRLRAPIAAATLALLLRSARPAVRAEACRSILRPSPQAVAVLIDLLGDLNEAVRTAAACALGRLGRPEARPILLELLQMRPSTEVIAAVEAVADDNCFVILGRLARTDPTLAESAWQVLVSSDSPHARAVARTVPRPPTASD